MKTLLYTGFDTAYKPLADITVPRMREYAIRHGIDFTCAMSPLIDVPNGIYWTGVCGALEAFKCGYDACMYLDVDQLITNFDTPWPPFISGFHASKDWGHDAVEPWQFSMCGFVAFKDASVLFEQALALEPEYRDKPFPEQLPMQDTVRAKMITVDAAGQHFGDQLKYYLPHLKGLINIHPRKVFNCVPDQCCPGAVPEPWFGGWPKTSEPSSDAKPADFAAHITMVPLERRVEIANEILKLCT